ncbi:MULTISPECIES: hypothetical protein [Pseudomonas]|uniref:hypothetical protein n=1 Tax=Pseudomonas TaxID=286 RepID=UPI001CF0AE82|nr:hypothetical protein [Pseudomonas sp. HS-18]UCL88726.1 hypothetical protein LDJ84_08525 [Pseudomonas sp. HS-18]
MSSENEPRNLDWRDQFDHRIESLNSTRGTPESEVAAAVNTYERLKTAKSIVDALHPAGGTELLQSVFEELCAESKLLREGNTPF